MAGHAAMAALLRFGMTRAEPVSPDVVERARARARAGRRLGDVSQRRRAARQGISQAPAARDVPAGRPVEL